jgi:hypothetical protein
VWKAPGNRGSASVRFQGHRGGGIVVTGMHEDVLSVTSPGGVSAGRDMSIRAGVPAEAKTKGSLVSRGAAEPP